MLSGEVNLTLIYFLYFDTRFDLPKESTMNKLHSMTSVAALFALSVTGTAAHAADNQPASASTVQSSEAKHAMMKKSAQHKTVQHKKAAEASCGGHKAGDASCGSNH